MQVRIYTKNFANRGLRKFLQVVVYMSTVEIKILQVVVYTKFCKFAFTTFLVVFIGQKYRS